MNAAALHLAILRSAALLVPEQQRGEWLAEWTSELWHARHEPQAKHVMATCFGAFKDALWLRRYGPIPRSYGVLHLDVPAPPLIPDDFFSDEPPLLASPIRCLLFLAILGTLAVSAAFLLPVSRGLILSSQHDGVRNLVMLTPADDWDADGFFVPRLSVSVEQFRSLKAHPDGQFSDSAFYLPVPTQVGTVRLLIARTSADLFRLLDIAIPPGRGPRLILADTAWKKYFNSDVRTVGREVQVGERTALIAGILSPGQWDLPGKMDGWLLEDDVAQSGLSPDARGFVLTSLHHATRSGYVKSKVFNYVSAGREDGERAWDDLIPSLIAQFLVGCLLVPITTRLSLGDYPKKFRLRQWVYLAAKILLVMPIMVFGSLDLVGVGAIVLPAFLAVFGGLFAMRWVLDDQRSRCPECLRPLSNPVRIGQSSHIFLEWHGTELICLHGHGLLHVPERPSIWFTRQRWMDLGPSWSGLFP